MEVHNLATQWNVRVKWGATAVVDTLLQFTLPSLSQPIQHKSSKQLSHLISCKVTATVDSSLLSNLWSICFIFCDIVYVFNFHLLMLVLLLHPCLRSTFEMFEMFDKHWMLCRNIVLGGLEGHNVCCHWFAGNMLGSRNECCGEQ
jgi:hypothetical protein